MGSLLDVITAGLAAVHGAGGLEGDDLRPIPCPWGSHLMPATATALTIAAVALSERRRNGYPDRWDLPAGTEDAAAYLRAIGFPNGVDDADAVRNAHALPLIHLSRSRADRVGPLEALVERIVKKCNAPQSTTNALLYLFTELTGNIWDHSGRDDGWVLATTTASYVEITIVDAGISIPFSYANRGIAMASDLSALQSALQGKTTKPQEGRGYGLLTSSLLVVDKARGFRGAFLLASRQAGVERQADGDEVRDLSQTPWQGTIAAMRIPAPVPPVDLYAFVER